MDGGGKCDFKVENSHRYAGRIERMSSLFTLGTKHRKVNLIKAQFHEVDAKSNLAIFIPQRLVRDGCLGLIL